MTNNITGVIISLQTPRKNNKKIMQQTVYIRDTITSDVITFTAFDSLIDKLKVLGIGKPAKFVYYVKECQSYFDNRIFDYKNLVGFTAL